jgi:hypothetical protein
MKGGNLLKLFNLPPTLPIGEPKVTEKKTSTPDPKTVISTVEIVADPTPIVATVKIVADPTPPPPSKISLPEIADLPLTLKVRKIKTRERDGR